ncbi:MULTISPECIES: triose-phosphate isomerase [Weeksella]|uniref:triose-phosphate isomerase n=1 Tax=Weeksella TaxID=1013 RepID=UPI0008A21366|nr:MULTISPECIES: triose-phosphate isomerase [Weeksella]MDK7374698.1 triose-phosphate isomerase [Weeksella virosa]OFM83213.1 triose-phosphate isomerase [Weeksella sp. HMSC059D05]
MRKKIVAGNWKMNLKFEEALQLAIDLNGWIADNQPEAEVIIAPSSIYLPTLLENVDEQFLKISAQDLSAHEKGAYTGDISAEQLDSIGLDFSLIGHSERRTYQHEDAEVLEQKMKQAFAHQIYPIFCFGENLEQRENNTHFEVVESQLLDVLAKQDKEHLNKLILAYEPVWAIGTGKTASPEQAQEMHVYVREVLDKNFGAEIANSTPILYGGSVNAENAENLFSQNDIDGGLVGGASLQLDQFTQIIMAAQ